MKDLIIKSRNKEVQPNPSNDLSAIPPNESLDASKWTNNN